MIKEDVKDVLDGYIFLEYSTPNKEFFEDNFNFDLIEEQLDNYYFYNVMSNFKSISAINENSISCLDIILMN